MLDTNDIGQLLKFGLLALCAGAGGFLGSYLKRKGENLATHEDIDKLITQVGTVTKVTKEIEARISSDLWDRQKQWELKRDAIFEVAKTIAAVKYELFEMRILFLNTPQEIDEERNDSVPKENLKPVRRFGKQKAVLTKQR